MYPFLHGYKQQIIYKCKIKTCVRAQNLKNLMLCNKKHKAQESCSSEKYEKNSFKTTYLFQHILERQKRPHSLYLHIVYSFSKRNCLSQVPAHAVKQCRTNRVTPISKAAFRELSSSWDAFTFLCHGRYKEGRHLFQYFFLTQRPACWFFRCSTMNFKIDIPSALCIFCS